MRSLAAASRCGGFRPAPGRNTSTEPGSARSARATASATCALDRRARIAAEIARLDRKRAALAFDHRRVAQKLRDPRAVERRRHHQQLEILAQALLHVARERQAEIGVERALVEFVEQHRGDAFERRIVEDQPGEDAFGDDLDAGLARHLASRSARAGRRCRRLVSPSVAAMRSAAARAASRRGSSTRIFLSAAHGSSISTSGTRVVLPAPGGATSTAACARRSAAVSAGSASSIGSVGSSNIRASRLDALAYRGH